VMLRPNLAMILPGESTRRHSRFTQTGVATENGYSTKG
jgi:hypothetical protein